MLLAAFEEESFTITVIMLTNKSFVVLIKNLESAISETKTRPSQNAFDSETNFKKWS